LNWVDLLIIGASGLALMGGYRRGVVMQFFSWGGFLLGLVVGGAATTPIVRAIDPRTPMSRAVAALAAFLGIAFIVEAIIAYAGSKITRRITHARVRRVDAILGSVVAGTLALTSVWFLSVPAKRVPELASALRKSAILRAEYALMPHPPDILAGIGNFLGRTGFPEVFAQLNPSLAPGVAPAPASLARDREVLAAARITYKIESDGCGGRVDGSGFSVKAHTVITAAHVVAGTRNTRVLEPSDGGGRSFPARVVYLDSKRDIAVLWVPKLNSRRMEFIRRAAPRGTDGAAIGYPGGGDRRISVARVRARTEAVGRDIYGEGLVQREIYVLRARVRQGNSGGPFIDRRGRLRGMIFAASAQNQEESYALAETEVARALRLSDGRTTRVDTRACAI